MREKQFCIIGAGASGLATARALIAQGVCSGSDIRLVDATLQTGRVCTYIADNGAALELGAGRISRELHPKAWSLLDDLNIDREPFTYHLKYAEPTGLEDLRNFDLHSIGEKASFFEALVDATSVERADRFCTLTGYEALRDLRLPREAGIEIATTHPESFLADAYRESWYVPVPGFEFVLGKALESLLSSGVELDRPRTAVDIDAHGGSYQIDLLDEFSHRTQVTASYVIFAMAPWELDSLHLNSPIMRPDWMNSIVSVPLFKGFLVYSDSWWDEFGFRNTCLITGNSLQKVYFSSLSRTIFFYTDSRNSRYWGSLRSGGRLRLEAEMVRQLTDASKLPADLLADFDETICTAWSHGISYFKEEQFPPSFGRLASGIALVSDTLTVSPGWLEGSLISADNVWTVLCQ